MKATQPCAWISTFERLFSLSAEELDHLKRLTERAEEIEPRRKLIDQGKPCEQLFILKTGWLAEFRLLRNGARQILNFRLPGDILGIECLAYRTALHSMATLTRCTVAPLNIEDFEDIHRRFPRLASALFLMTLREGAILHEWEVNLGRRSALPRVGHLLLELDRRLRARGLAHDESVRLPLTQEDIAECTGLTTPYVNRILQKMRGLELIRFEQQTLEILDRAELARTTGFDTEYIEGWRLGRTGLSSEALF
ncbi:Crp/Fnr family transcriptional regulator [Microvirga sp. BT688]|uniref:Crp/Fnr family transcriptional regulator n=1 Tax=Microvirga sp. TaxID=1873136 RepID=UPI001684639C|nr:Crp/Fnr family transcriptional regulator [Microvirga sp.]MBD2750354.1 Crp/Fnr family transcriptional regulator [Microvirga sp.]